MLASLLVALGVAGEAAVAQPRASAGWQSALDRTAAKAPEARMLALDIRSGRLLGSTHLAEAARTLATPGSTLKPPILYYALASGRWSPERRVACSRTLRIANHRMDCSHPAAAPMDAAQALAWSCNSYFAALAGALTPEDLRRALAERGLLSATGLSPAESAGAFRLPRTREEVQLAALGVEGVRVTLLELAQAYRSLANELAAHPETAAATTVREGLADSASFGMAGAASLGGVPVAGKTGTASAESGGESHGWFVGLVPAQSPQAVVAVYLPRGRGSDAARVAAILLSLSPVSQARKP
jgi:stage II sporulation protein D